MTVKHRLRQSWDTCKTDSLSDGKNKQHSALVCGQEGITWEQATELEQGLVNYRLYEEMSTQRRYVQSWEFKNSEWIWLIKVYIQRYLFCFALLPPPTSVSTQGLFLVLCLEPFLEVLRELCSDGIILGSPACKAYIYAKPIDLSSWPQDIGDLHI